MSRVKAFLSSNVVLYILLAGFALLLACLSNNYDYDLYARLIVGEHFFKTGTLSYKDFVSYTPTHLWYDHEWGSSLVFYAFLKLFGNFGLVLIQAFTIFFTTFFVIQTQKIQKHPYPVSIFFITIFMILFSHQNPSIVRCHMFSFMFFSMFLYFLEKTRRFNSNILWLILPITVIWNNLHGGVVSGLGMIFIYMVCAILSRKPWRKYFGVLVCSTLLLVINPYGVAYLDFLYSANTKNRSFITEWWGVFVQRHAAYYYPQFCAAVFAILLSFSTLITKKKYNFTKLVLLIVTAALGILHVKLLSLSLIVIASLYYNDIGKLFSKSSIRFLNKFSYVVIAMAICFIPLTKPSVARTHFAKYPIMEVEFLKLNNITGNLLTSFGLGSYTSYKLYPNNLVYMDGRYEEVYYDREFDNLIAYESMDPVKWETVLKSYPTQILMPEKSMPVYQFLQNQPQWEEVYTGNVCAIFLPRDRKEHNQSFILPPTNIDYYKQREFENLGKFGEKNI